MQARGAKILLLNCTPALCPMYERIGFVRYKPAYCDVGGMGLQVCDPNTWFRLRRRTFVWTRSDAKRLAGRRSQWHWRWRMRSSCRS